ncbi:hypothetical protein [Persicitalea jodogahamensis]|uniref:Beta-lactamase-related domain-containing protein n=1 Tax=Persicitalea jodogahamensis TaxID=402147 RepID=A0A8J3G8F2_9BACT|nr:hypothetical protein [Persicitalea jodogahamensis]GHB54749.1 hypothetical protein GCM10007390_04830 [Persicitalea jodogahamensis]
MKALFIAMGFLLAVFEPTSYNTNPGKTKQEKIAYVMERAFEDQDFIGNVLVADRGLIKLETRTGEFFDIQKADIGKITIHQLLTHSSGINEVISKEKDFDLNTSLNKAALKFRRALQES